MKKYLIVGAWALVAGLFVTSCTHDDDLYQNGDIATQKTEAFQKAFVKAFGQINPNQNWGFYEEDLAKIAPAAARASRTRTVVKQDMTDYPAATAPDPITPKEAEYVTDWFQKNPGLSEEGKPWKNFYVQFVSGDQTNKKGIWHRYDQNRINNGYDSNYWDEEFTDNGGMDKLHVGATRDQNATDHLNDFNAKTGGPWDVVYVKNGSAMQWGYHSSWGEDSKAPKGDGYYWYFKMAEIEVPGYCFEDGKARVGCYVGLSLYGKKYDNGDKELGYQRLQYAEDWILKVVPGEPVWTKEEYDRTFSTYGTSGRVFCEDLGDVSYNDIDYNDVVFDAQIEHRTIKHYVKWYKDGVYDHTDESVTSEDDYAHITLLAAGGTMPLTVAGTEVHNAFGVGHTTMVNTVTDVSGTLGGAPYISTATWDDPYIELEPIKGISNIDDIEVIVNYSNGAVVLKTTPGLAPHKILVLADYVDDEGNEHQGTAWAAERQNLGDAYPNFKKYVASPQKNDDGKFVYDDDGNLVFVGGDVYAGEKFWEGSSDPDKLFGSWKAKNCGEARYTTKIKEDKGDDNRTIYVIYYKEGEGYDISSPLYFMNSTQLTDKNISANDIIRVYGTAADPNNWRLILNDGNSKALSTVGTSQGAWTGYYEFVLTESMVSALKASSDKAAMIISGVGLMVTEVDLIKAK